MARVLTGLPSDVAEGAKVACVVPVYHEQDIARETARFWCEVAEDKLVDLIVLVSTVKEQGRGPTTHELVEAELRERGATPDRIVLVRCEEITRFRAAQLNVAVETVRSRLSADAGSPEQVWVGVYNADSRPHPGTFAELRSHAAAEPQVRLFQQLVDYVVPERGRTGLVSVGNSVLQTWWTMSHYVARNRRGRFGTSAWSRTAPYSTFGHGEFVRLDFIDYIRGFPEFAYADGLLLGWICRLAGEPIGLLASLDVAEVPRNARDLFTQQTAWLRGLLNFGATVKWSRQTGILRLSDTDIRLLRAQHLAIPVAWGVSTAGALAGLMTASRRLRQGQSPAFDLAVVGGLLAYPLIPASIPSARQHDEIAWGRRVLGALVSWPVEGLAFWPALISHVRGDQHAPTKTPR